VDDKGVEVDMGIDEVNPDEDAEDGLGDGPPGGPFDTGEPCPPSNSCSGYGSKLP
jgi:hypothetical protein